MQLTERMLETAGPQITDKEMSLHWLLPRLLEAEQPGMQCNEDRNDRTRCGSVFWTGRKKVQRWADKLIKDVFICVEGSVGKDLFVEIFVSRGVCFQ